MSNRPAKPSQTLLPAVVAVVFFILIFGLAILWQMLDVAGRASSARETENENKTPSWTQDQSLTASPVLFAAENPPVARSLNGTITNIEDAKMTLQTLSGKMYTVNVENASITRKKIRFASPVLKYGDGSEINALSSRADLSVLKEVMIQAE